MGKRNNSEIEQGLNEYFEHQNPIFDKVRGGQINTTLFDINEILKEPKEDFEDNNVLDEDGDICIDWLWDLKTGKLKKDKFKTIKTYQINKKTYNAICTAGSDSIFIVDLNNKRSFPGLKKGIKGYIKSIDSFGNKEILIFKEGENTYYITSDGEISENYVDIEKISYGKIDILECKSRINPNLYINDFRTKLTYLGSDGKQYKPKYQQNGDIGIKTFEEDINTINNSVIIDIED